MSSPYPEPKPHPGGTAYAPTPPPSNAMGLTGFIFSIVGIFTCGLTSPIGALLSLIGVFKEPRGMAVAGLILGLFGSIFLATFGFVIIMAFMAMMGLVAVASSALGYVTQYAPLFEAQHSLVSEWDDAENLPTEAEGNEIIKGDMDAWGKQIKYVVDGKSYTLVSAGEDGKFDTSDDRELGPFFKIEPYDIDDIDRLPPDVRKKLEENKKEIDELIEDAGPVENDKKKVERHQKG